MSMLAAPRGSRAQTPLQRVAADFVANPAAVLGLALLAAIALLALLAPLVSPQNPYDLAQLDIMDGQLPPGAKSAAGATFWLGTDDQARDMLSAILIALILIAVVGQGVGKVIAALITVQWAYYARTVRSAALVERRKEYIEAAHGLALSPMRIVLRHLLPNCLPPLIVVATVQVAHAITLEATLSFLGLGLPITEPSLGPLIANGYQYLLSGKYWISFFPGIALLVTIVSVNLVADQLRDALNPRLQR
jgi:peptide/nickel transport system permease protein